MDEPRKKGIDRLVWFKSQTSQVVLLNQLKQKSSYQTNSMTALFHIFEQTRKAFLTRII